MKLGRRVYQCDGFAAFDCAELRESRFDLSPPVTASPADGRVWWMREQLAVALRLREWAHIGAMCFTATRRGGRMAGDTARTRPTPPPALDRTLAAIDSCRRLWGDGASAGRHDGSRNRPGWGCLVRP
jgi:hypothetical protein